LSGQSRIMAHMVAGYPDAAASRAVARGLSSGGCAYIELQFPFSDPTADGPDIQRACSTALEAGFTVDSGFETAAAIGASANVPLFIMSYANLVFTRGMERFLADARASGARGIIVPDLPPDYDEGLFSGAAKLGLAAVPVLSPSMREERLSRVGRLGAEYLYVTLRTGTTGSFTQIDSSGLEFLSRVAALNHGNGSKVLGGFGVSTREQVVALSARVHAVVVGSTLVRLVAAGGDIESSVREMVRMLAGTKVVNGN
jgi:tryptophan synthase alpha chain